MQKHIQPQAGIMSSVQMPVPEYKSVLQVVAGTNIFLLGECSFRGGNNPTEQLSCTTLSDVIW